MQKLKLRILWIGSITPPLFFLLGIQIAFFQNPSFWDYCVLPMLLSPIAGFICSLVLLYLNSRFQCSTSPSLKLFHVSLANFIVFLCRTRYTRLLCLFLLIILNGFMMSVILYQLFFALRQAIV